MEFITETINGEAATDWRAIQQAASKYKRAIIRVSEYSDEIMESEKQRKWLNGAAIPYLAEKWGCSHAWVKTHLKVYCGEGIFKRKVINMGGEVGKITIISSENELTLKQARQWIENILDYKPCDDAGLEPPDPEWRKRKAPTPLFEET